ncbi:methyl-accepting chemotaxis protein [Thalassospira marina]|uniref:Chemotaxis protein n=1 Tax=Thalassospira marina TaxID=2048283 RepID=A0A2N3KXM5_9PROT|nr:methyl-accepting chemotaxis protein [Thalassospira marina]PKR55325.1 chemotaxis protein [Thalassospira marina]
MVLKNVSIAKKIFGGFGVILALLLVIAVVGGMSLRSADQNFKDYRNLALQTNLAGRVQANLLEARLGAKDFLLTKAEKSSASAKKRAATTLELNGQLVELNDNDDVRGLFKSVADELKKYIDTFDQVVDLTKKGDSASMTRRDALVHGTLDVIGPKVAADLEQLKLTLKAQQDELGPRATRATEMAVITSIVVSVVALILGVGLAIVVGRGISNPIVAITDVMSELAHGNKTVAIPGQDHKDEIGDMAAAVLVFKENMIKADELAAKELEEQKRRQARTEMIDRLTTDFDQDVSSVLKTVASAATEMQATAQSMTATAEETSRQSTAVAAASDQASNNVQTVASAAEELSASINEISHQVSQSSSISSKAVDDAERTNAQVRGLADAAQKIGDVVNLINDIANQTNLLALNATIEAARAGEAGKGFAVVAAEVKNLASATARATDEITSQITSIQNETRDAVVAIQSIGGTIAQINEIAANIASAVEQQGAATQEITRNVQQASAGTSEVTQNIGGVTEAASSTGAAAEQVLAASGELSEQSERLRTRVEQFLTAVRTA